MANQKYDNVTTMVANGELNWVYDRILAFLVKGATFDASHVYFSDVMGAGTSQVSVCDVTGKSVSAVGEAISQPVVFYNIPKETNYQVILGDDRSLPEGIPVLCYYDANSDASPIRLVNNGTLIVRPVSTDDPPTPGVWFTF
jgi:hypothetical protein